MKEEILFPVAETAKNSFMNRIFLSGGTGCRKKHDSYIIFNAQQRQTTFWKYQG